MDIQHTVYCRFSGDVISFLHATFFVNLILIQKTSSQAQEFSLMGVERFKHLFIDFFSLLSFCGQLQPQSEQFSFAIDQC